MNKKELYNKIDLFFEARLSREEEQRLLRTLLKFEGRDPTVDEALAVMLASRLPAPAKASRRRFPRSIPAVAAAAAALIGIGAIMHHYMPAPQSEMLAYVGGSKISDPDEIMKIIDNQLSDIGESSELFSRTVSDDLDDIREALILDDI